MYAANRHGLVFGAQAICGDGQLEWHSGSNNQILWLKMRIGAASTSS